MPTKFEENLKLLMTAGHGLYCCETADIKGLRDQAYNVCSRMGVSLYVWTREDRAKALYITDKAAQDSQGNYLEIGGAKQRFNDANYSIDLPVLLQGLSSTSDDGTKIKRRSLLIVQNAGEIIDTPFIRSIVSSNASYETWAAKGVRILFTAPIQSLPKEIMLYTERLVLDLPTVKDIEMVIEELCLYMRNKMANMSAPDCWAYDKANYPILADRFKGMKIYDIRFVMRQAQIKFADISSLSPVLQFISEKKASVLKASSALELLPYERQPDPRYIGGFDNLLKFVSRRKEAMTVEAKDQRIDTIKGIILMGIPGTGKSMAAKAIGRVLDMPVVILDVGSLFGSLVGESESRVRNALSTVDAMDGCVLVIDEADKALAGARSEDFSGDSGTSQRVLGTILSWLQDKTSTTFVVLTLNRTDSLPPEFLRLGRFDRIFYTDLPSDEERRTILDMHFKKRGCYPRLTEAEWRYIVKDTENFVGAELEVVVTESRLIAFYKNKQATPSFNDIMEAIKGIVPMAQFDAERIARIRKFCVGRATPVSSSTKK